MDLDAFQDKEEKSCWNCNMVYVIFTLVGRKYNKIIIYTLKIYLVFFSFQNDWGRGREHFGGTLLAIPLENKKSIWKPCLCDWGPIHAYVCFLDFVVIALVKLSCTHMRWGEDLEREFYILGRWRWMDSNFQKATLPS